VRELVPHSSSTPQPCPNTTLVSIPGITRSPRATVVDCADRTGPWICARHGRTNSRGPRCSCSSRGHSRRVVGLVDVGDGRGRAALVACGRLQAQSGSGAPVGDVNAHDGVREITRDAVLADWCSLATTHAASIASTSTEASPHRRR
jgi:hypothetical protein